MKLYYNDKKREKIFVYASLSIIILTYLSFIYFFGEGAITGYTTLDLQPNDADGKDAYIRGDLPSYNGNVDPMLVGLSGSGDNMSILLQFNISSIPSGSTVTNATLSIYVNGSSASPTTLPTEIHRITESWNETVVNWTSGESSTLWSTQGGAYSSDIENQTNITTDEGWFNFTITALVQGWVNTTYTNNGLILISDGVTNDYKKIYSSDSTDSTVRPKLSVDYTENAAPSITAVTDDSNSTSPTEVESDVNFTVTVSDIDSDQAFIYICNSSTITGAGCDDTELCSTGNTTIGDISCQYTAQNSDLSTVSYWALACDNEGECSSVSSEYNFSVNHAPVVLVVDPNGGETINQSQDDYLIQFNVSDSDNNSLTADIYYSSSAGSKDNLIVSNVNLTTNCTDTDGITSTTNNCSYSWNSSTVYGTYYLDIEVNDSFTTTTDSSDASFNVRSLDDDIAPNVTDENITANLSSGETAVVRANVTDNYLLGAWCEITNTEGTKTNHTMTLESGDIYYFSFQVEIIGTYYYHVFANDTTNNIGNGSLTAFTVSAPNLTTQSLAYQSIALPNELIYVGATLNTTDLIENVSAYLNDSGLFTFLTNYPQNTTVGNVSAGNTATAQWLIVAPSSTGTYNLSVVWSDQYGNSWNSSEFQIKVSSSGAANPVVISADAGGAYYENDTLIVRARLEDQGGVGLTGATPTITIYYPNASSWVDGTSMTEESNGYYNYTNNLSSVLGTYNVKINGTYLTSSSTAQTSFTLLSNESSSSSSSNLTLVDINCYPEVQTADPFVADILVKDENGDYVNASAVKIRLYDSLGNLVVGPVSQTSQPSTGIYRYTYTTPSTPEGQWEIRVNVTRNSKEYFDRQYWYLVGGPFDVRDISIIDSTTPSLSISVVTENTGGTAKDMTLTWNLTRTDTNALLDSGADTFAVNPYSNRTWTISPSTTYTGQAKITFLGYYSGTEKAGAYKTFTITEVDEEEPVTPTPSPGDGGGGGGGRAPTPSIKIGPQMELIAPTMIEVIANKTKIINVIVKNTGDSKLTNLILTTTLLPRWQKIEPEVISSLNIGESVNFEIKLKIDEMTTREFVYIAKSSETETNKTAYIYLYLQKEEVYIEELKERYIGELATKILDKLEFTMPKRWWLWILGVAFLIIFGILLRLFHKKLRFFQRSIIPLYERIKYSKIKIWKKKERIFPPRGEESEDEIERKMKKIRDDLRKL